MMGKDYDATIAFHYSAYRPALHPIILERLLPGSSSFGMGLDIGCGTGHSTKALAHYCNSVLGIDPNQAMLGRAVSAEKIIYRVGTGDALPLDDSSVDLVTFAGSLYYAKTPLLVLELARVCKASAQVLVYDFEIRLDGLLEALGVQWRDEHIDYDHAVNLSDSDTLRECNVEQTTFEINALPVEIAHILLSDAGRHGLFRDRYDCHNPLVPLSAELEALSSNTALSARIFASSYCFRI